MMSETNLTHPAPRSLPLRDALRRLMATLRGRLQSYRRDRDQRDAFLNLLRLDDVMLDDIGVTRAEVERLARQPLGVDASDVLMAEARRKRREADPD